jgi:NADPH:quinone reductase-like Zn-dependent oxidoreductase
MKAIVQERFGPPETLRLADTDPPEVGADDVLVRDARRRAQPADWHIVRGDPLVARLMGIGLTKPKAPVAGIDAAGVVEAVGANVRGWPRRRGVRLRPRARSPSTRAPRQTWWCRSRRA